jgi:hypothetical protein
MHPQHKINMRNTPIEHRTMRELSQLHHYVFSLPFSSIIQMLSVTGHHSSMFWMVTKRRTEKKRIRNCKVIERSNDMQNHVQTYTHMSINIWGHTQNSLQETLWISTNLHIENSPCTRSTKLTCEKQQSNIVWCENWVSYTIMCCHYRFHQ